MSMMFVRPELEHPRRGTGSPSTGTHEFLRGQVIVGPYDTCDFTDSDYATDDAAIQAAMTYIDTIMGGTAHIMCHRYIIQNTMIIPDTAIIVEGDSIGTFFNQPADPESATHLQLTGNNINIFTFAVSHQMQIVRDMCLDGVNSTGTAYLIYGDGACDILIERVFFMEATTRAVFFEALTGSMWNIWIVTCWFEWNSQNIDLRAQANHMNRIHVINCLFYAGPQCFVQDADCRGVKFVGCTFEGCRLDLVNTKNVVISGCTFDTLTYVGSCIYLNNSDDIVITGNLFFSTGDGARHAVACVNTPAYCTIVGNNMRNVTGDGVNGAYSNCIIRSNVGWVTEANVLSPAFAIDAVAVVAVVIPHGLDVTPVVQDCQLTVIEDTDVDDWAAGFVKVETCDAVNVNCKVRVTTASATAGATAKLALHVTAGWH
jgi:hypothetical protein